MTTLVSFELARLLKEKSFDEPCLGYYDATNLTKYEYILQKGVKNTHFIF